MSDKPNMIVSSVRCLHLTLPMEAFGRDDILIAVEYGERKGNAKEVACQAWAQIGDAFLRGLVDEFVVPAKDSDRRQKEAIVAKLNKSERLHESLPGFIEQSISLDPASVEDGRKGGGGIIQ